jgi:hypothetical protein
MVAGATMLKASNNPTSTMVAELARLERALRGTVDAVIGMADDIERLAARQAAGACYGPVIAEIRFLPLATPAVDEFVAARASQGTAAEGDQQQVPPPPPLTPNRYVLADLRTPAGRRRAARLWAAGHRQVEVARHFGGRDAAHVSLAVTAWLTETVGRERTANARGEERRELIRQVLAQRPETAPARIEKLKYV